jgi:putative ribosome biogenesis GTPase RsgA
MARASFAIRAARRVQYRGGDWVRWQAAADEGTIESVVERTKSFLSKRQKFEPNLLPPI